MAASSAVLPCTPERVVPVSDLVRVRVRVRARVRLRLRLRLRLRVEVRIRVRPVSGLLTSSSSSLSSLAISARRRSAW